MKSATTVAALLAAMLIPTGAAKAQQWGGVAGIAESRGYSASPTMSMPAAPVPEAVPVADESTVAPATPRVRAARTQVAELGADRPHHRHVHATRTAARPHPAMVARAKRSGTHRRARIA